MIKCILFDRDGTLGELQDKRYPSSFVPYADIRAVFTNLKGRGYKVGIITNQSSIARGTGAGYDFDAEFTAYNADIWKICPHDNGDNCGCRKPKSGLLLDVCAELKLAPSECVVVGDRTSDILCAVGVGATAVLVETGYGKTELDSAKTAYPQLRVLARFDEIMNVLDGVKNETDTF